MLTISGKTLGRKQPLFADFGIPVEPDWGSGDRLTLRVLIDRIVRREVAAFLERQTERRLLRCLTAAQIEAAAETGKIDSGGSDLDQQVDPDAAVGTALQAFEDGIYLVVLDGVELRELDHPLFLNPDSHLTFVRLALLAGG